MSVDYYAHAVIGCKLDVDKLYQPVIHAHIEHQIPDGARFCPICGKPAFTREMEAIFDEDNEKLGEFEIVWATDKKEAFVGYCVEASNSSRGIDMPDVEVLKSKLVKTLSPLGLWADESFGLWAVLYCSY